MKNKVIALMFLILGSHALAQSGPEFCKMNNDRFRESVVRGLTPIPVGKIMSPFRDGTSFGSIKSSDLFRAASGFYCDSVNYMPLIYASNAGFTVVGPDYEKNFPPDKLEAALLDYQAYLKRNKYFSMQKNN